MLSLLLIVGVASCFLPGSSAGDGQLWTASKSLCDKRVKSLDSVSKFIEFANEMDQTPELDSETTTTIINDCLNSYDGVEDVRAMKEMVQALTTSHSVCDNESFERMIAFFFTRITGIASRSIATKKEHGLRLLTSKLFGQVILTCKRSLETKLEQAEQSDEAVKQSLDDVKNDQSIRKSVHQCLDLSKFDLPESLILTRQLRVDCFANRILLETEEEIEKFLNLKRSCNLIDSYARNSIIPIELFATHAFTASDNNHAIDKKLKSSQVVGRWLKAVQYCRCAFLAKLPEDVYEDEVFTEPRSEPKIFEVADQFNDIESDLQCKFPSQDWYMH